MNTLVWISLRGKYQWWHVKKEEKTEKAKLTGVKNELGA